MHPERGNRGRATPALATAVVLLVLVWPVGAEERPRRDDLFQSLSLSSRDEPIHIDSDSLELDYKQSTVTYHGNVQVRQGDVTLTSDRLAITYDPGAVRRAERLEPSAGGGASSPGARGAERIKEVVAEGRVQIRQGQRLAEGRRAVFDQAAQTIVLSQDAILHEGPNSVAGERIVVYLREERSVVESGENSRVKAVLYPGSERADQPDAVAATTPGSPSADEQP